MLVVVVVAAAAAAVVPAFATTNHVAAKVGADTVRLSRHSS